MADSVKVFGERNTGTNWLEDILMNSVEAQVIHHRGILRRKTTKADKAFIGEGRKEKKAKRDRKNKGEKRDKREKRERRAKRELVLDRIFLNDADDVFGWKHACTSHGRLSGMPGFGNTGFVLLVKHPTWWLSSLQRRPYHSLVDVPDDLVRFAEQPWITTAREYVREVQLASPVELWNRKVRSYLDFAAQCPNAIVIRYEDFLANYEGTLIGLCEALAVPYRPSEAVTASSKNDDLTTEHYRKKYLETSPRVELGEAACDAVKARIDPELAARFDYLM